MPGKIIVAASDRQTVITCANDFIFFVDNAGAYLGTGILTSFGRQKGHPHEIFIPRNIILAFFHSKIFSVQTFGSIRVMHRLLPK